MEGDRRAGEASYFTLVLGGVALKDEVGEERGEEGGGGGGGGGKVVNGLFWLGGRWVGGVSCCTSMYR